MRSILQRCGITRICLPNSKGLCLYLFTALLLLSYPIMAQQTTVTGTVLDPDGETIPGVNILEEGTLNGAVSDLDGRFTLEVSSPNAVLVFSFVGFETQEVPLEGQTELEVTLGEGTAVLDEVVVIGYGTLSERDLTSSITTVRSEDIVKTPSANPMQSLQGRVAGVQIVSSGAPGASPTVRVRGVGS